ncbi:bifunctional folylpolyglutamate synthase/dihydrofolate synthase [Bacillus rubiinfantis]|uniref:bifunctional folylpolyglutamate synthase/dihydrofolate synthase n=1 Tax=Bacillus rubiinfantis TaxID=1499680 RepID=UPI0005AB1A42|nr:folylpolyglutamate synthase/dihydrofolate synthase family protein [Bacillus rubiinfantis]
MFTTYNQALEWIHGRLRLGIKPGLKRMEWMMDKLGHPEAGKKAVHIGGTNGKGSTVTFLRSILQASGFTVGTFTSPYIEQFNERISVNGKPISDEELLKIANVIYPLAIELEGTDLGGPTEFEIITAMAFYYFSHHPNVDIVLYEVGLGGRYDSTNIIQPLASIITNIGLDHTNILGETYGEIAFEKAGIIKKNTAIFTAVKQDEALQVITDEAEKKAAPLYRLGVDFIIDSYKAMTDGESFNVKRGADTFANLEITMLGRHQTENATLAVVTAMYLDEQHILTISQQAIRKGLKQAFWPGRFEVLSNNPAVIIDGAHNNEGIDTLAQILTTRYADRDIHIIFAALKDKKYDKMIARLDEIADEISFVSFDFPRAAKAEDFLLISNVKRKQAVTDWHSYIPEVLDGLKDNSILVITGSLYFISEVKPFLTYYLKNKTISL